MTIKKKSSRKSRLEIDLTGPDGNAFHLLGLAGQLCKTFGFDKEKVLREMQSSDYENLVQVFDDYFGSVVTLYR